MKIEKKVEVAVYEEKVSEYYNDHSLIRALDRFDVQIAQHKAQITISRAAIRRAKKEKIKIVRALEVLNRTVR